jgi:hypothetical protein
VRREGFEKPRVGLTIAEFRLMGLNEYWTTTLLFSITPWPLALYRRRAIGGWVATTWGRRERRCLGRCAGMAFYKTGHKYLMLLRLWWQLTGSLMLFFIVSSYFHLFATFSHLFDRICVVLT